MSPTDTIAASIAHHVRQHHPPHRLPALRDAHPKHHGCVRALFVVEPERPDLAGFRQGVFARPGAVFPAWVRFSNALKERHDLAPDARGMAVKLMDVEGSPSRTQDFLMVSHHVFFARTAEEFVDFPAAVSDLTFSVRAWLRIAGFFISPLGRRFRIRGFIALFRSLRPTWNPLAMEYFSQTPYRFGPDSLMKYSAQPHEPRPLWRRAAIRLRALAYALGGGTRRSHDMLRRALVERLRQGGATFDFCVQLRQPASDPSVDADDALTGWSRRIFPWRKIAEVRIQPLGADFDEQMMMDLAQHLSFTPWHTVPAHEPVGTINEARRVVYERISRLRHDLNGKTRREPDAAETAAEYLRSL